MGLLGMVAMVASVEGFVWHHPMELSDYMAFCWRTSAEAARGSEARADVICLGDSLVKVGVLPRVLEARLGGSARNLAVFAGQAPSSFFLLRRAFESGATPRAIIVDFHPNLLSAAARSTKPYWADLVDARDGLDLGWNGRDLGVLAATVAFRVVPSTRDRLGIRDAIRAALRGEERPAAVEHRALRRNWSLNGGAHLVPARPHAPEEAAAPADEPTHARWAPRPVNSSYVRRLLDLAAARGVPVFWVLPPMTPAWQARRERLDVDGPHTRFVRSMAERDPNVVVVDGRHAGYAPAAFVDATHLNRLGATEFTAALADLIAARREGAGVDRKWVQLPAFRGRAVGVSLEDFEESKLATGLAGTARR